MTEPDEQGWIKHDGGPQPVADDVEVDARYMEGRFAPVRADYFDWGEPLEYRIVNQHLIDAALEEGFRQGLEAVLRALEEAKREGEGRPNLTNTAGSSTTASAAGGSEPI